MVLNVLFISTANMDLKDIEVVVQAHVDPSIRPIQGKSIMVDIQTPKSGTAATWILSIHHKKRGN